jgi:restriction endonuclease S subunit
LTTYTPWLPARTVTQKYILFDLPKLRKSLIPFEVKRLDSFVDSLKSGEYIPKRYYLGGLSKYIYLSVNNFSGDNLKLDDAIYIDETIGKEFEGLALKDNDLIVTRSGTVGKWRIFKQNGDIIYLPSHHLSFIRLKPIEILTFLKYYLNSNLIMPYVESFSTGKSQKEINNWSIKRIPIPTKIDFNNITNSIVPVEKEINILRAKLSTLQDIIEDIFIKYRIKTSKFIEMQESHFLINFGLIGNNDFIRLGALYYAFSQIYKGMLFDHLCAYPALPLNLVLKRYPAKILKKGPLDEPKILIDLEQLEAKTGRIIDVSNLTSEIGSDKVEFGNCDILISKIDPYLAYVFLNDNTKPLIGTTELIPFNLINGDVILDYVKYCLLSYEYILKSSLLMYGKRHPRIHIKDLLSIRIPIPPKKVQQDIISKVKERELENKSIMADIEAKCKTIDSIISLSLNIPLDNQFNGGSK